MTRKEFEWKMGVNPNPSKQTRKVILSRKAKRQTQAPLTFNNNLWLPNQFSKINVRHTKFFLHLKIITKNNANYHIQSFHSTHLHYADFLRTQAFNGSFKQKQMLICQDWSLKMSIMNISSAWVLSDTCYTRLE